MLPPTDAANGKPLANPATLVQLVLSGNRRALSRTLTEVENQTDLGVRALELLFHEAGRAHVVGVTGSAGSGKSTLTAALARALRREGRTVGIIAVDPSSPFTRGAILGDRIRMQDLTADAGVFVRSMATRGAMGGLAATSADLATVFDAAGWEIVLLETVGAGQDEIDVVRVADTTLVVNTPGMGDDIQAIKAGILEIADILVVNKADLPGSDAVAGQLRTMLSFVHPGPWPVPVIKASALKNVGIDDLVQAVDAHGAYWKSSPDAAEARVTRARERILGIVKAEAARRLIARDDGQALDAFAQAVIGRTIDPRTAARHLLDGSL